MASAAELARRRRRLRWWILVVFVGLLVVNVWGATRITEGPARARVPYSPFFLHQVAAGNVASITSKGTAVQGTFANAVRYPPQTRATPTTRFATEIPAFADTAELTKLLERRGVVINAQPLRTGAPFWETLAIGLLPTLLLVGLLVWLMRRATGGAGGLLAFGRSRARRVETPVGVSFADVAGIDEAKEELAEIVDFLRSPEKYRRLGARIPRSVLLSGPPGGGKTLLARAVAGESGAPFFSLSASEFIEMIVGVGASRVRDLFKQAKDAAPAIVFIDELDAIGRARGPGLGNLGGGGSDEREQTLNQILTEMDGFDSSTNVIVLAATNRPDVLDPALLRPGRFDRRVAVQPPDLTGRKLILAVHTRGVPLAPDVDLEALAATTPGMVGADLANLANEASLLAARRGHEQVAMADFTDSLEKIVLGAERKIVLSVEDRARTAYHEAGHALVGMLVPAADPVRKVSIIPRGGALGVTFSAPASDRFTYRELELRARLAVALGGRAAEELVYGDLSTSAGGDIRQVTDLARQMVGRFGMSDAIGPIAVLAEDGRSSALFPDLPEASEQTRALFDGEVHRLVDDAYADVRSLLASNRARLDALAALLLERETLDAAEAYAAAGVERAPAPLVV